jgi:hypothetical protein
VGDTVVVHVQPEPSATASVVGGGSSIQVGQPISLTGAVGNASGFSWMVSGGSGAFTPASGVGSDASTSFTLSTGNPGDMITLTLTALATSPCAADAMQTIHLTVGGPAALSSFTVAPAASVCSGTPTTFTAVATGATPITYTFKRGTTTVQTGGSSTYTIASPTAADSDSYTVEVSNAYNGSPVASSPIALVVTPSTSIGTQPPSGVSVCPGSTASFSVAATGQNITYLWQFSTDNGASWNAAPGTNDQAAYTTSSGATDGTQFRCVVTGDCGVETSNTVTLTIVTSTTLSATIELDGVDAGPFTRCITLDLYSGPTCSTPAYSSEQPITFTGGVGSIVLTDVPCGSYTGVAVRDRLHTLRRVATSPPEFDTTNPNNFVATFTSATGKALRGGNVNDDAYIDILDFGGYIGRSGQSPGASTTCSTPPIHPDFSGNGSIGTEDFTFIQSNFLVARDPDPCGNPLAAEPPVVDITIADLVARGEWEAARGDLNLDGRLNAADITFAAEHGLPACRADFNHIGGSSVQDIFDFVRLWMDGHPAADINDDRHVSVQDIFDFLSLWFAGC